MRSNLAVYRGRRVFDAFLPTKNAQGIQGFVSLKKILSLFTSFYRSVSFKVGSMSEPRFKSLGFALNYFISHNPARAKYRNILEPEGGSRPSAQDFSGDSPNDVWADICRSIHKVMKCESLEVRRMFWLRNAGDRSAHLSISEIAVKMGLDPKYVGKTLRRVGEDIENDLIRKGLVEPRVEEK